MKLPVNNRDVVIAINLMDLVKVATEVRKWMAKETGLVFFMNPADSLRMWQYIPEGSDFTIRRFGSSMYFAEEVQGREDWVIEGQSFAECLWRVAYLYIAKHDG